jgi:hypothetical protein
VSEDGRIDIAAAGQHQRPADDAAIEHPATASGAGSEPPAGIGCPGRGPCPTPGDAAGADPGTPFGAVLLLANR